MDVPFEDIRGAVCHSPLTFIERVFVNWGVLADMCGARASVGGHENSAYTFASDDYSQLVASDQLFARKFDENVDLNIVKMLLEYVKTK